MSWEGLYLETKKNWAEKNKVGMIVFNSNCQKRNADDSFEDMIKHAKKKATTFRVLLTKIAILHMLLAGRLNLMRFY